MIKYYFVIYFLILFKYTSVYTLVIPQELPSILSLVYSTIPQVRKGHDSRFGFGFRLGNNADVQFVVELGPQSETNPIGQDASSTSRKRAVSQSQYNALSSTSETLLFKRNKTQKDKKIAEAANWLKNWSKDQHRKKKLEIMESASAGKPPIVNGMINLDSNTITIVPEDALDQLTALYKIKNPSN